MRSRLLKTPKSIKRILLSTILLYMVGFSLTFFMVSSSLFTSISKIRLPDDYFLLLLDQDNPQLEASYSIYNRDGLDFTDLTLNLSIDMQYTENISYNLIKSELFTKVIVLNVAAFSFIKETFIGGNESFNMVALQNYWASVENISETKYFMNLEISGRYCLGTIPFRISIHDFEIGTSQGCPNCGVAN